jgi:hypothetical protein
MHKYVFKASAAGCVAAVILSLVWGTAISRTVVRAAALQDQEISISDLLKWPGRVIAEGDNSKPAGNYKVKTYRIEEVSLPHPTTVVIRDRQEKVTRAFRVTIIGGPFVVRALPAVVWIGNEAVGYGIESEDLDEITAITFDPSLMREGATLYLSYGGKESTENRAEVPEKLKLKKRN